MRRPFVYASFLPLLLAFFLMYCMYMPGTTWRGQSLPPSVAQIAIMKKLRRHLHYFAEEIGPRNYRDMQKLDSTAAYIEKTFSTSGLATERQTFHWRHKDFHNIIGKVSGSANSKSVVVIGAHYDTTDDGPGANDNASGVAALLFLAEWLSSRSDHFNHTPLFVAFTNEEPPFSDQSLWGAIFSLRI